MKECHFLNHMQETKPLRAYGGDIAFVGPFVSYSHGTCKYIILSAKHLFKSDLFRFNPSTGDMAF